MDTHIETTEIGDVPSVAAMMASQVEIRGLRRAEISEAFAENYVAAFGTGIWNEDHCAADVVSEFIEHSDNLKAYFLVSSVDDVPVAGAEMMPLRGFVQKAKDTPANLHDSMFLNELFVHPDNQESGIGSLLLGGVEQAAASLHFSRVSLWTHAGDKALNSFYRKRGYDLAATIRPSDGGVTRNVYHKNIVVLAG